MKYVIEKINLNIFHLKINETPISWGRHIYLLHVPTLRISEKYFSEIFL
jgi:hypothetical protein